MQSWGEHGIYGERHTADFPTRSGLLGLFASASGVPRGAALGSLTELDFTVRIDRPGVRVIDFHTVGGGYSRQRGIPTAEGGRKNTAILTRRHYLSDAVFTVACTGPDKTVTLAASAIQNPTWQPFLGRRSCPPEEPLFLGVAADAEDELLRIPLPPRPGRHQDPIDFVRSAAASEAEWTEIHDDCDGFPRTDRRYRARPIARTRQPLADDRYTRSLTEYHDKIGAYVREARS